jgi:hypothetical protein
MFALIANDGINARTLQAWFYPQVDACHGFAR